MERIIKHNYFFAHSPEKVWHYLTNSDLMELWLMKNNFQPVVGTDFQFRTNPVADLNFDGIFYCTVLEVEPFKKLSYSWKSGPGDGKITLDSVVVWKLEATTEGTKVYLEHSGFDKEENLGIYDALNNGWPGKFVKIENLINA
ncbi:SRPBCC domain-containing protein [Flavobacterium sp. ANB]|uniref:SRPBCC family protein n=1 Tax=unclassified Flavobacterium TaxID=196869 RepID=UPI0012B8B1C5|nr:MULTISPECIES: SRPBCC domain-containing protein [unclassified Flavobacterium]MBF4515571.1 SRPBCC domain-containing protein [Flavobacterium sp. ANB]MTD68574.1 hypothetical protein [Flavobacterium sp. LC2016-13]